MTRDNLISLRVYLETIISEAEELVATAKNNVIETPRQVRTIIEQAEAAKEIVEKQMLEGK